MEWVNGQLPLSCRRAVLTLLPKKGDQNDITNWRPVSLLCTDYKLLSNSAFPMHGTVWFGTARYGTAHFGSVAFPLQFSTAIEWAGLFTRRYSCAASTAMTSS